MAELSVRYATALFDLGAASGVLNEYLEQAAFLRDMLGDGELRGVMEHPHISSKEKRRFIDTALYGNIHGDLLGFLCLAIAKNRESVILPALTEFISMGDRHNRRTTADVVSAVALNESQAAELRRMLSHKLNKQVELSLKIDPSVIGGLYIHVDGYFIDHTIKKRLNDMKDSIKRRAPDDTQT